MVAKNAAPKAEQTINPAWGTDGEELETRILTDKADLIGVPFKIIGFEIERNEKRQYDVAFVYALDVKGTEFCFADSADTGVRKQVQDAAKKYNLDPAPGAGFQKMALVIMGGLRTSEYPAVDGKGKEIVGRTFYLEGKAKRVNS